MAYDTTNSGDSIGPRMSNPDDAVINALLSGTNSLPRVYGEVF